MSTKLKGRALPNMRGKVYRFPEGQDGRQPPTNAGGEGVADIKALAQKHSLPPTFDLVSALDRGWYQWRVAVQIGQQPTGRAHRRFLSELATRAEALDEALQKAGAVESAAIHGETSGLSLRELNRSVHELSIAARVAIGRIPSSTAGVRGNPELRQLLCSLFRTYREALGENCSRITRGAQYSGLFFDFVSDVLRLQAFQVKMTNVALGKAIERALADVDGQDAASPE